MIALIQLLFLGHVHKWKIIDMREIYYKNPSEPYATMRVLQCEHCGKLKYSRTDGVL